MCSRVHECELTAQTRVRVGEAFLVSVWSVVVVLLGVAFGLSCVEKCTFHRGSKSGVDFLSSCAAWDGQWYCQIVDNGYSYVPGEKCNVAFFPVYPCVASVVRHASGCRSEMALVVVSNCCFVLSVVLLREYLSLRFAKDEVIFHRYVILVFCSFPTTFYFHVAYSESMFVAIVIATLYGIERKWNPVCVALLCGIATGTRVVGVAVVLPVIVYIVRHSAGTMQGVLKGLALLPLACSGIVLFVMWQWYLFDEPLAFLKAQKAWEHRVVPTLFEKSIELVTFRPIWATYIVNDEFYWGSVPPRTVPELNMHFFNPIYWLFACVIVLIGCFKRRISYYEGVLCAGLLIIPYVLQGPRAGMTSCGRYSAVAFPVYFVVADIVKGYRLSVRVAIVCGMSMVQFLYASMYARWYWFF